MPDTLAHAADRQPVYPLPAPEADPRFTSGLIFDVADVLTGHGFPRPGGTDWAHLMTALVRFLYQPGQETPIR